MSTALPILQSRHLRLRPSTPQDALHIFAAYQNPAFLQLYSTMRKVPETVEQMQQSLEKRQQISPFELKYFEWMLVHDEWGVIGIAALNRYDNLHQQAEFLIGLFKPEYQHRGYGIEGTLLCLEMGFKHLQLQQIYSLVYDYNQTAEQQLIKLGFQLDDLKAHTLYSPQAKRHTDLRRLLLTRAQLQASSKIARLTQRLLQRDITQLPELPTPSVAKTPFSCTYSEAFPALLQQLNCSLIISAYQTGRVMLLGSEADKIIQLPRVFKMPMGLAVANKRLAIATQNQVIVLANATELAATYPNKPNTYDALYAPRASYFSGVLDIHDMAWGDEGLWAVNTRFSCLVLVDDNYSFTPRWQPPFIRHLKPNDHCHLNGLAIEQGKPRYVTALGTTDVCAEFRCW